MGLGNDDGGYAHSQGKRSLVAKCDLATCQFHFPGCLVSFCILYQLAEYPHRQFGATYSVGYAHTPVYGHTRVYVGALVRE